MNQSQNGERAWGRSFTSCRHALASARTHLGGQHLEKAYQVLGAPIPGVVVVAVGRVRRVQVVAPSVPGHGGAVVRVGGEQVPGIGRAREALGVEVSLRDGLGDDQPGDHVGALDAAAVSYQVFFVRGSLQNMVGAQTKRERERTHREKTSAMQYSRASVTPAFFDVSAFGVFARADRTSTCTYLQTRCQE